MVKYIHSDEGRLLDLPGRKSLETVSGNICNSNCTVRLVEIPVPNINDKPRTPHCHIDFEECIYVMSGRGMGFVNGEENPVEEGDTVLIEPGEWHYFRNVGNQPLKLLCFFPVGDSSDGTMNLKPE
ncbi:MAG: cupin domain-containing protein [Desulfobulbia bacterium]